ncbi:mammalian cell entry protein [Mycobacterium sp. ZZG]
MSPVRRIAADADDHDGGAAERTVADDYFRLEPKAPVRWGLPLVSVLAALVVVAAIAAATFMLVRQLDDRREAVNEASALGYTSEFMVMYTSLDPFNANDYADRVAAQATGEFAKNFADRLNEILVQVARSEPSTGEVLAAGVQRWNDDGSADVLIATKVTSKSPDGKSTVESGSRWVATTIKEGQQWKISNLVQVI